MGELEKEITPPEVYFNRRTFLRAGIVAATTAGTAIAYRRLNGVDIQSVDRPPIDTPMPSQVKRSAISSRWAMMLSNCVPSVAMTVTSC